MGGASSTGFPKAIAATQSLETIISTAIVSETTTLSTAISTMESNVIAAISTALSV